MLSPGIIAEVVVPRSSRQYEEVIVDGSRLGLDASSRQMHSRDLGEENFGVLL